MGEAGEMRIEYVQTLFGRHFLIGETSPDLLPEERKKRIFRTQKQLSALSAGKLQRGKKACTDCTQGSR